MDTTFITILLVLFLVIAGLAIDVGYIYIDEEELQHVAETAALAGVQSLQQRIVTHLQKNPAKLAEVVNDPVQETVRTAARESASGKHDAAALVGLANDNTNSFGSDNDITVGFWNYSAHSYTAGGKPVNAVQVRARRTAESASVGMGTIGTFVSRISGIDSHNFTPVATAAIPARTRPGIVLPAAACDPKCTYPQICTIPERKMVRGPWGKGSNVANRFAYSSLRYQVADSAAISGLICNDAPSQSVCGKPIYVTQGSDATVMRDLESFMYNPAVDKANKEFDPATGRVTGWWVIVPLIEAASPGAMATFETQLTTRYALIRINRICASGPPGCGQQVDAPAGICAQGEDNAFSFDRISCVSCSGNPSVLQMPGLQPMLVK